MIWSSSSAAHKKTISNTQQQQQQQQSVNQSVTKLSSCTNIQELHLKVVSLSVVTEMNPLPLFSTTRTANNRTVLEIDRRHVLKALIWLIITNTLEFLQCALPCNCLTALWSTSDNRVWRPASFVITPVYQRIRFDSVCRCNTHFPFLHFVTNVAQWIVQNRPCTLL